MILDRDQMMQIQAAYAAGYSACMANFGHLSPYISLKQANDTYGRRIVARWIEEGLVEPIKDGDGHRKCRINREQIEIVASMSNRNSFFQHNK